MSRQQGYFLEIVGGPDRDRTGDLFHAMEARSQLRHRPTLRKDTPYSQGCSAHSQSLDMPMVISFAIAIPSESLSTPFTALERIFLRLNGNILPASRCLNQ